MSFDYTDEQLNNFNWGKNVYSVNEDYVNRHQQDKIPPLLVVDKDSKDLLYNETNIIKTPDDQMFQVIKTYSDPVTGFDGMAVAPILNGEVDYESVAVVAAGTDPNAKDLKIKIWDKEFQTSRDLVTAGANDVFQSGGKNFGNRLSPQYSSAERFLLDVIADPRVDNVSQLTGYSQSSYMTKLGAKYGIPTTTFNAWFYYNTLTPSEWEYIENHPEQFRDYRTNKDKVVIFNDFNNPYLFGYSDKLGTIHWIDGDSHDINGWKNFDPKTGRIINPKTGKPFVQSRKATASSVSVRKHRVSKLKTSWSGSGKRLSKHQMIFLDAIQAQSLGSGLAQVAQSGAEELLLLRDRSNQQIEDLWSAIDFHSYSELAPWEVKDLFASYGITHERFVGEFQQFTDDLARKMVDRADHFIKLEKQIGQMIDQKLSQDQQLAGEFNQWTNQL